ncbi:hypothetical protein F4804DRAFT_217362 [Jackrogersella minutella]|nr:hypothetical protein F4804DRAFT_217362 [Jackrogersella minutella]
MMRDYPEKMAQQTSDPNSFCRWLEDRLDSNVFRFIYGPRTSMVIDIDKTFADKEQLSFWYFQQIFCSFGIQICDLVRAETALNPGVRWSARPVRGKRWKTQGHLRMLLRDMFDKVPGTPKYQYVELESFVWVPAQRTPEATAPIAEHGQYPSQAQEQRFDFAGSRPPPLPSMPFLGAAR